MHASHPHPEECVYLVAEAAGGTAEVFVEETDAQQFADALPEATVTCMRLRSSLHGARTVTERRAIVAGGQSLVDFVSTTLMFVDGEEGVARIGDVDVESFRCSHGHWHLMGLGLDHAGVIQSTQVEIDLALDRVDTGHDEHPSRRDTCVEDLSARQDR